MKIVTVIGARPQFIKAANVSRFIRNSNNRINEVIVHTGQHFDSNMSEVFFRQLDICEPDYNLNINNMSHGAMTGKMLSGIEEILQKEKPEYMLVYGDTNSTIAGALAARKLHVRVAHVEAGLRSFNMKMPEEINRILTDRISNLLFCPTEKSIENLNNEGFRHFDCNIVKSGDVMYDAAIFYGSKAKKPAAKIPDDFVLLTLHRAENTDDLQRLISILNAIKSISSEITVVFPVHPRTKKIMEDNNLNHLTNNLVLLDPVGYLEMIWILKKCQLVLTDSGGLQKEAFFFRKKCVTLRDETEWVELVDHGLNYLAGSDEDVILKGFNVMMASNPDFEIDMYGNGNASAKIVDTLLEQ